MIKTRLLSQLSSTLAIGAFLITASCKSSHPSAVSNQNALNSSTAPSLDNLPAEESITKETFKNLALKYGLKPESFEEKWNEVLDSDPVLFVRSFAPFWYNELKNVSDKGEVGYCFGDAHFDNFGFLRFKEGVRYVFNDFDDSGLCPVRFDILRYFTILSMADFKLNDTAVKDLISHYYSTLQSGKFQADISNDFPNDVDNNLKKIFKKSVDSNGKFITDDNLLIPSSEAASEIKALFQKDARLSRFEVFDIASRKKTTGGSGSLKRFWVSVRDKISRTQNVIELKEYVNPATSEGNSGAVPPDRILRAQKQIWKNLTPELQFPVPLLSRNFVIRSLLKDSLKLEKLSSGELLKVLTYQVEQIAKTHRASVKNDFAKTLVGKEKSAQEIWLFESTKLMAERETRIFKKMRDTRK